MGIFFAIILLVGGVWFWFVLSNIFSAFFGSGAGGTSNPNGSLRRIRHGRGPKF